MVDFTVATMMSSILERLYDWLGIILTVDVVVELVEMVVVSAFFGNEHT